MAFITSQEIEAILNEVVDTFLIPKFNQLGMNATGEWLANLEVTASHEGTFGIGVIRGRHYSEQLAFGRKPGTPPPIQPLIQWVQAKFGISGQEAVSAAFAISKKIAAEGTTWYQKGGTDLIEILESPQVREFFVQRLSANLITNAESEIKREIKELIET